ncbi:MAG: MBL fold metallo-hydrolase [Bacteroidota bacterium]|nr:MBL fold metallo-hydrolase [Bacteroidota bacterium]
MIKITFKNVGQGDSIIIEWNKDDRNKIALIDCNLYQESNPVLKHITDNEYTEIEYVILSHPHYDHFSGFLQLLKHCKENNIHIKYFLHTSSQTPSFLKMATKSATSETELQNLFLFIQNNFEQMNMQVGAIQAEMPSEIPLSNDYSISVLAPSQKELNNYISGADYPFDEENPHNNPKANWLSTILKINTLNGYVLLTSDVDKSSLIRIDIKHPERLQSKLILAQSPHHGAKTNHNNAFWRKRNRETQTPIVFSVGTNSYDHPSEEAVKFFRKNDYKIFSTNKKGALSEMKEEIKEIVLALNMFSIKEIVDDNDLQGDKIFDLD